MLNRSLIDLFGNNGVTWNCAFFKVEAEDQGIELHAKQGHVRMLTMGLWPLSSVWKWRRLTRQAGIRWRQWRRPSSVG